LYAEVRKAAEEAGKPYEAERWLIEQYEALQADKRKAEREEFQKQLMESLQPLQMRHLEQQALDQIENTREVLGQQVDAQGNALFPELEDPQESYAIGKAWVAAGMPPELALSPQGAANAVLLYRFLKAQGNPAVESTEDETTETEQGEAEDGQSPAALARSAMLTGEGVSRSRASDMPPEVARLMSAMRKTGNKNSYFIED
jgi:hypothetical protein